MDIRAPEQQYNPYRVYTREQWARLRDDTPMTLEPGDIIATGTPDGVGAGMTPQEWLWPGDVVEAGIDGIGVIRHPVVAI